jgi:hypothetical protein
LNVGAIIVEQLDWDGHLKTLTFKPNSAPDFWVALLDEYGDESVGPFHILDPEHDREFGELMSSQPARLASGFQRRDEDAARFETSWRGIPTVSAGRTIYALCLPENAVPDRVIFVDPRPPNRTFSHREVLDRRRHRVVCYLDCRSRYGKFDFNVEALFRLDRDGNQAFRDSPKDGWELDELEDTVSRLSGEPQAVIQQFFEEGSTSVIAQGRNVVVSGSGLVERAKTSRWAKTWGVGALAATAAATILLALRTTDLGIAGLSRAGLDGGGVCRFPIFI